MSAFKIAVITVFCFSLQVVNGEGQDDDSVSHSCAVSCSDNVICWGDNRYGQLGSDVNIMDVKQISAGGVHTCVLKNDGTVACWGNNKFGQLGNEKNNGKLDPNFTPLDVNIADVKQISAGFYHTCVLKNDGNVACWGDNEFGQLGNSQNNGKLDPNFTPLDVNIADVKQILAGFHHTCVLKNDGNVACWGNNKFGQLGNEKNHGTENPNFTPLDVNILNVKQISAGFAHTCVLKNDGNVACWGDNESGQLGNSKNNGTDITNFTPLDVNIMDVKQISARSFGHTCALKNDMSIFCWGAKFAFGNGQHFWFLDPNFYTNIPEKMAITQKKNIVQVTAGSDSTCILYDTREVYCTGLYDFDDPNRTFSFQPDKSILLYNTATAVDILAESNDENICSNTKNDDPKLSVPAIVGIVLGSVLLCGGILYFILKGPIGKSLSGIGHYVQLTA